MDLDIEEIELYDLYSDYIRNQLGITDMEWSYKTKWCVLINKKYVPVISYHNWKLSLIREEKLNQLLNE